MTFLTSIMMTMMIASSPAMATATLAAASTLAMTIISPAVLVVAADSSSPRVRGGRHLEDQVLPVAKSESDLLSSRCFEECMMQNMTPRECKRYIENESEAAGGHEVGPVHIRIQNSRSEFHFSQTYWMVEVPANVYGQVSCDDRYRGGGKTYYPLGWKLLDPYDGEEISVPVQDIDCQGLTAGQCCVAIRRYGQTSLGRDTKKQCLGCFPHREPLVPVYDETLGVTLYEDLVLGNNKETTNPSCEKVRLTNEEALVADGLIYNKIQTAINMVSRFRDNSTCVEFEALLESLYDASMVLPELADDIGRFACNYCYDEQSDNLPPEPDDRQYVIPQKEIREVLRIYIKMLLAMDDKSVPSITKNIITIFTNKEGNIVDTPKLGGGRFDKIEKGSQ